MCGGVSNRPKGRRKAFYICTTGLNRRLYFPEGLSRDSDSEKSEVVDGRVVGS